MTRDQARALHAYEHVREFVSAHASDRNARKEYKTIVTGFGATVLRSGLAAAIAFLERQGKHDSVKHFLEDLGSAEIFGIGRRSGPQFPAAVRALTTAEYMLATRDALKFIQWFKRAVQAQIPD